MTDRARPTLRRRRKRDEKPPMPAIYEGVAEEARRRHKKRVLQPGVTVDVEKTDAIGYTLVSPHRDEGAWVAMICDALGTRSVDTANTFLRQLTQLCPQYWHDDGKGGGEWSPDEDQLNMVLAMVAGIKPRNEMEAALAAQMVAVHLMTMRTAATALKHETAAPQYVGIAGKLARTFAMQMDAMAKAKGKRTTRQKITVSYEKHEHKHVHVHSGGERENGSQPHASTAACSAPVVEHERLPTLPGGDEGGKVVLLSCREGESAVPNARGPKSRRSEGRG
jgi:hypothetical protein